MKLIWRWIIAACLTLGVLGAIHAVYQRFFREHVVRIAVVSAKGQDAVLLGAINDWLTAQGRRTRLRLVESGGEPQNLDWLRSKKVEIASLRSDSISGQGVASMMVLYNEVAVLLAPEKSPVTSWRDLNRRPLGVTAGTSMQDPLLQALLRANGVDDSLMVTVAPENVREDMQKRAILAVAFVTPVPGNNLRQLRRFGSFRDPRGPLNLLDVPDAETLALRDKRYAATTIPTGALRPLPPLPDEATETLAAPRHLMVREGASSLATTRTLRDLLEATRALQLTHPLLAQAGAPDIAADAFVRVHKGPKSLFNGEDRGLTELVLEWIYVVPLVLGALATLGSWLYRWLLPRKSSEVEDMIAEALALRRSVTAATRIQDVMQARQQFEQLAGQVESRAVHLPQEAMSGLLSALDLCDRRIDARRAELDQIVQRTGRAL